MEKLRIAKLVINFTVGSSASYCVRNVICAAAEPESIEDTIKLTVGSIAIGSLVAKHTSEHVDQVVDSTVEAWQNFRAKDAATT